MMVIGCVFVPVVEESTLLLAPSVVIVVWPSPPNFNLSMVEASPHSNVGLVTGTAPVAL